jgi:hypothetical protein
MKTAYPSSNFLTHIGKALAARETIEIGINGGWRGYILSKEVLNWLPIDDVELVRKGSYMPPSAWCSLLMMGLHGVHYTILSANYELCSSVNGTAIQLTYSPL